MEFGRAWHCLFVGENKTGEGELSRRGWRWRLKREVEVKKGRENCQEEQGKLRGEETGGKAESVWGKRGRSEQEARAILSSGGILLQEKLGADQELSGMPWCHHKLLLLQWRVVCISLLCIFLRVCDHLINPAV